jgi:hypothetical protein
MRNTEHDNMLSADWRSLSLIRNSSSPLQRSALASGLLLAALDSILSSMSPAVPIQPFDGAVGVQNSAISSITETREAQVQSPTEAIHRSLSWRSSRDPLSQELTLPATSDSSTENLKEKAAKHSLQAGPIIIDWDGTADPSNPKW